MRAAFHTSVLAGVLSMTGEHIDPELLRRYIGDGSKDAQPAAVSPNAAAATMSQMFPGLCR